MGKVKEKMVLNIYSECETDIVYEDVKKVLKNNYYLTESYKAAVQATNRYIKHSDKIRKDLKKEINKSKKYELLYRAPQNIIAFSGGRGTGKTSTMMSFTDFLSSFNDNKEYFGGKRFIALNPIDPTMLENNQNFLNVVLSRLYSRAEDEWMSALSSNKIYQNREDEKNKLLKSAKKCLNGINAIKSDESDKIKSLDQLQKVGDSATLKKNLYEFVDIFNRFCLGEDTEFPLLVISIDDTDCQISKAYEVMEDIRRYLSLPNVIILMATDTSQLREVLTQHYLDEFKISEQAKLSSIEEIEKRANQYMIKLLPPSQKIHLPVIDDVFKDKIDILDLQYFDQEEDNSNKLLKSGDCSVQSKILNCIFNKTGLVFVEHSAYINDIVPTTLRELHYFLNFMNSLDSVFPIDFSFIKGPDDLATSIERQAAIVEENLDKFEAYFMNDWVPAKVSHKMEMILRGMAQQASDERVGYAYRQLKDYYSKSDKDKTKLYNAPASAGNIYINLDWLLKTVEGHTEESEYGKEYLTLKEYYEVFAVRTILMIKSAKDAWKEKRNTIINYKKDSSKNMIIFNYAASRNSIPSSMYMNKIMIESRNIAIVNGDNERGYTFVDNLYKCLSNKWSDNNLTQVEIYKKQEIALLVAISSDLQAVLGKQIHSLKQWKNQIKDLDQMENCPNEYKAIIAAMINQDIETSVNEIFVLFQNKISQLNDSMLKNYREETQPFIPFTLPEESKAQPKKMLIQDCVDTLQNFSKVAPDRFLQYNSNDICNLLRQIRPNIKELQDYITQNEGTIFYPEDVKRIKKTYRCVDSILGGKCAFKTDKNNYKTLKENIKYLLAVLK